MSFLTIKHPKYEERAKRINYAADHYEGLVVEKKADYLYRYAQGEPSYEHEARVAVSDYTPHYTFAVNSLGGQLFPLEGEAERSWGRTREEGEGDTTVEITEGLGDPSDEQSIMYRLWSSIDGEGTNYPTLWRQLAPKLVYANIWGVLVEGPDADHPEARVVLISPADILDWADDGSWIKVRHQVSAERDWTTEAKPEKRYTIYGTQGWTRYREGEKGVDGQNADVVEADGTYAYFENSFRKKRILPIRFVKVAIDAPLGYIMAQKANAIFNQESARDWSMFKARFQKLAIHPDAPHTDEEIDALLKKGQVWMRAASLQYASPSAEGVMAGNDVLRQKVEDFYTTFFRSYEDVGAQKTATEVIQDNRSGIESYLTLLKTAIDEAENFVLAILEQIYFPNDPKLWGGAYVERSDKFQPTNAQEMGDRLAGRYVKDRLPIGRKGVMNVMKKLAEIDGIVYDEDELALEVDEFLANAPGVPGVDPPSGDGEAGEAPIPGITRRDTTRITALRRAVENIQRREGE